MAAVVFITGASSGIGESLAKKAPHGAKVFLVARRQDRLQNLKKNLETRGVISDYAIADVTKPESLRAAVSRCEQSLGSPSIVIANAGFGVFGRVENLATDDFRRQYETNFFAVLETFYATKSHLLKTKGQFVLMGSAMSYFSTPLGAPYASSKYALRGLSEALFHEMRPLGVGVTLLCPGLVVSEFRSVDNYQRQRPPNDPAPSTLSMPTDQAAGLMWKAIRKRKREAVITLHAKFAVSLVRHFPDLFHFIVRVFGIRARRAID